MVLAKAGSAALLGRYSLALAIVAPVVLLTRLQLRAVIATDVEGEHRFGEYLALRLVTNLAAFGAIALLLAALRYGGDFNKVVLALTLVKTIENTSDVFIGRMQRSEWWRSIATASFAKTVCGLGGFVAAWMAGAGLVWSVLAFGAGELLVVALYEFPLVRAGLGLEKQSAWPIWNRAAVLKLLSTSAPLGSVAALVSLIVQVPRYFVEAHAGAEALGHWAALTQLATATSLLRQPLGQASLARLALYKRVDSQAFRRLFLLLVAGAGAVGIVGVGGTYVLGGFALGLFYRPEYEALQPVFLALMIGMSATHISSAIGFTLTAARCFRSQLMLYVLTGAVSAASCWLLIPQFGLMGAAYAHGATWLVACFGGAALLGWHQRRNTPRNSRPPAASLSTVAGAGRPLTEPGTLIR